ILSPELLYALRSMGHRQELAIVDSNYPCDPDKKVMRLDGVSATQVLDAVLSVTPLERDEPESIWRMIVDGQPEKLLPIFTEFQEIVSKHEDDRVKIASLSPEIFKKRARDCVGTVISGERRLYGCILFRKGVIRPD